MLRRICALILALALTLSLGAVATADSGETEPAGFTDVMNPDDWFYAPVYAAANAGIIAGNADGTFAPYDELNRAQAVAFAVRLAQYNSNEDIYGADDQRGEWYEIYIDYARDNGIVSEEDSPTPWESEIDRADAATIFAAVLGEAGQINDIPDEYFADVPADDPAYDAIYALARAGICNGKGVNAAGEPIFGTNDTFLRSEVAAIVARIAGIVETVRIAAEKPNASDEVGYTSGTCGENLVWEFSGGTLTISGTGAMDNYVVSVSTAPWAELPVERIIVEEGVEGVGVNAFRGLTELKEVSLPDSLTVLDGGAFEDCTSLREIVVPDKVKILDWNTFAGCTSLERIDLGRVRRIFEWCFSGCTSLRLRR